MFVHIFLTLIFVYLLWKYFDAKHEVDGLPGPYRWPIIGNILTYSPDEQFEANLEFTKLYGERYIFKILKRRILNVNNPEDIEAIVTHSKNLSKSYPYKFLESWLGDGLILSKGRKWQSRRKVLATTFHLNILKNFSSVMEEKSRDLVDRLRSADGAPVDLLPAVSDFTFFTICETAMGIKLDSDHSSAGKAYKKAISKIGYVVLDRVTKVWMHNEFVFRKFFGGKSYDKIMNIVHDFADKVILEKKKKRTEEDRQQITAAFEGNCTGSKKRLAMLDLLLEAERNGQIDVEGIRDEVNTFLFGGLDITAVAITFCLMLLADHEDVQERIFEERQQVLGDLSEMKYLEAVVKEALRLYPSVPLIGREVTEDFFMRGLKVPKGTHLSLHLYEMHHREDLFPDPEAFKPERFFEGETRHPYSFLPFSAGPRNCIGQKFAMLEIKCVVSELCRYFRIVPETKGFRPRLVADMVMRPAAPIMIKFIPRDR